LCASFIVAITGAGAVFMPGSTAPVLPFVFFVLVLLFARRSGARARNDARPDHGCGAVGLVVLFGRQMRTPHQLHVAFQILLFGYLAYC
jgi:hypothetical protein